MGHARIVKSLQEAHMASIDLLAIFILPMFVLNRALGDGITLETDKASYTVGETVFFSGLGYFPSGTAYVINVSYGGSILASVGFASDESGLEKYNGEAEGAKELAELLSDELEASSQNKPALGRHLGPLVKITKALIKESSDVINGFG